MSPPVLPAATPVVINLKVLIRKLKHNVRIRLYQEDKCRLLKGYTLTLLRIGLLGAETDYHSIFLKGLRTSIFLKVLYIYFLKGTTYKYFLKGTVHVFSSRDCPCLFLKRLSMYFLKGTTYKYFLKGTVHVFS